MSTQAITVQPPGEAEAVQRVRELQSLIAQAQGAPTRRRAPRHGHYELLRGARAGQLRIPDPLASASSYEAGRAKRSPPSTKR